MFLVFGDSGNVSFLLFISESFVLLSSQTFSQVPCSPSLREAAQAGVCRHGAVKRSLLDSAFGYNIGKGQSEYCLKYI